MSAETYVRAVLGAVALFILFRLARAARSGRVRFAGETFSRAEMPLVYWLGADYFRIQANRKRSPPVKRRIRQIGLTT